MGDNGALAADMDRRHFSISLFHVEIDPAGATHFHALIDVYHRIQIDCRIDLRQKSAKRGRSASGRWVLGHVVQRCEHPCPQMKRIAGFPHIDKERELVLHAFVPLVRRCERICRRLRRFQRFQRIEFGKREWQTNRGVDRLVSAGNNRRFWNSGTGRDCGEIDVAEYIQRSWRADLRARDPRFVCQHLDFDQPCSFFESQGIANRTTEVRPLSGQDESRSDIWMPGKRYFGGRGEDPDVSGVSGITRRQDKSRLREVEFCRDLPHFVVAEFARIGDNRQWVAGELTSGENIDCCKGDTAH